ncbi:MAG: hypothetical protein ABSH51_08265 [Solirubrobacteraceae bacterium]
MNTISRYRMSSRSTVIAVLAGATIAGCGSSETASRSSRAAGVPDTIEYAACLRAHGVRNFADPSGGGGLQIPNDINPAAPAFRTAQRACRSLMPDGSGGPGVATAQQKQEMVQEARCMRAHGVPGFPDPVSSPPTNFAGVAEAFGRPGAFVVIPVTLDPQAPRFKQAGRACHLPDAELASS